MKKQMRFNLMGFIIILFSTPLGYMLTNFLGKIKGNLAGEYIPLLNGFIHSIMLVGFLVFCLGFQVTFSNKSSR